MRGRDDERMAIATAYLDTNFFSVLHYTGGQLSSLAQHLKTRQWWELERGNFKLFSSTFTQAELSHGVFRSQEHACALSNRLPFLPDNREVRQCTNLILQCGLIPANKPVDAIQLALATVHRMDYLLTWNYAHLANVNVQRRLEALNSKNGWRTPFLVSPETIPWLSMGQNVRRKDG